MRVEYALFYLGMSLFLIFGYAMINFGLRSVAMIELLFALLFALIGGYYSFTLDRKD